MLITNKMKIDNGKSASKVRIAYVVVPSIIVLTVGIIYLTLSIGNLKPAAVGVVLLGLYAVFALIFHFNYVIIFVGPDKVMVRYKALFPINTPNNSIEINTADYAGYEIVKKRFRTNLILYRHTPGGKAKYPEVCINLLSTEQIDKLKRSFAILETIKKQNR